jgi:hypothetical protein
MSASFYPSTQAGLVKMTTTELWYQPHESHGVTVRTVHSSYANSDVTHTIIYGLGKQKGCYSSVVYILCIGRHSIFIAGLGRNHGAGTDGQTILENPHWRLFS